MPADRGYPDPEYTHRVHLSGGKFIIRGKKDLNPRVPDAYLEDGNRPRRFRNRQLNEVRNRLPKKKATDPGVGRVINAWAAVFRMIVQRNPEDKEFRYLITDPDPQRYPLYRVSPAYRLRWQAELLFKERKSYANLHASDTGNPHIAQGPIRTSLTGAAVKRFLSHAAQLITGAEISARKVAMCAGHVLRPVFHFLKTRSFRGLRNALPEGVRYPAVNALRAHPKRDRKKGRSRLGSEPIIDLDHWLEVADDA